MSNVKKDQQENIQTITLNDMHSLLDK